MLIPVALTLLLTSQIYGSAHGSCTRRVCYHSNWGPGEFLPEYIDPDLCTHLIYMYAEIYAGVLRPSRWDGEEIQYAIFNDLKKKNPELKTLLSVGGDNMPTTAFTRLVFTEYSRSVFIEHAIKFLRDSNFDGLDVNWQFPGSLGSPRIDKEMFTKFIQELSSAFTRSAKKSGLPRLLLSATVSAWKWRIERGYDVPAFIQYLDMLNVMTYGLHEVWEGKTGHNSPLYNHRGEDEYMSTRNMNSALNYWVKLGADKMKINVGLPTYGVSFTLENPSINNLDDPTIGPGDPGKYTMEPGLLAYYEVCELITHGATTEYIPEQKVPYLFKGDQWVGYDDPKSIRTKVAYINAKGYGGFMVFNLGLDDFNGTFCDQGKFPLTNAAKDVCLNSSTDGREKKRPSLSSARQEVVYGFHTILLSQFYVGTALLCILHC